MAFENKPHYVSGAKYPLAIDAVLNPPVACAFKPGDKVVFTNDQGVVFSDLLVTGFSPAIESRGRFIYLDTSSWWFPVRPENLKIQGIES